MAAGHSDLCRSHQLVVIFHMVCVLDGKVLQIAVGGGGGGLAVRREGGRGGGGGGGGGVVGEGGGGAAGGGRDNRRAKTASRSQAILFAIGRRVVGVVALAAGRITVLLLLLFQVLWHTLEEDSVVVAGQVHGAGGVNTHWFSHGRTGTERSTRGPTGIYSH